MLNIIEINTSKTKFELAHTYTLQAKCPHNTMTITDSICVNFGGKKIIRDAWPERYWKITSC